MFDTEALSPAFSFDHSAQLPSVREERRKEQPLTGKQCDRRETKESTMKAYAQDLREKVVQAMESGKTREEVVDVFGVSLSPVKRYLRQKKRFGHIGPKKKTPGRPSVKGAPLQEKIREMREAHPDATFQEHGDFWEQKSRIRPISCYRLRVRARDGRKKMSQNALAPPPTSRLVAGKTGRRGPALTTCRSFVSCSS